MASHSSTLAWKILWVEEPGRLQSKGSLRVGHDWATSLSLFTVMHWRRKWQPSPVFLPGESQARGSLVGCHLWGLTEWSDLAAAAAGLTGLEDWRLWGVGGGGFILCLWSGMPWLPLHHNHHINTIGHWPTTTITQERRPLEEEDLGSLEFGFQALDIAKGFFFFKI